MRKLSGSLLLEPHRAYAGGEHSACSVVGKQPLTGDPNDYLTGPPDQYNLAISGIMFREDHGRILAALDEALASPAEIIVLHVDSPGGEADNLLDSVRVARGRVAASGKRVVAWVSAMAASAGYAWACVANEIYATPEALVGSVGVIQFLEDFTGAAELAGVKIRAITSGERKADGQPDVPTTDATIASMQSNVDALASGFFELVAEARGMSVEDVAALQGGTMVAKFAGTLVDATVARSDQLAGVLTKDSETMTIAEMVAAITAAAEKGDEEAVKALEAFKAAGVGADDLDEAGAADDKDPPKAADDPPPAPPKVDEEDEEDEPSAAAASAAVSPLLDVLKTQNKALAKRLAAIENRDSVAKMIAARPDLDPTVVIKLTAMSPRDVKTALDFLPPTAAVVGAPTQGKPGTHTGGGMTVVESNALDLRLGLAKPKTVMLRKGSSLILGAQEVINTETS